MTLSGRPSAASGRAPNTRVQRTRSSASPPHSADAQTVRRPVLKGEFMTYRGLATVLLRCSGLISIVVGLFHLAGYVPMIWDVTWKGWGCAWQLWRHADHTVAHIRGSGGWARPLRPRRLSRELGGPWSRMNGSPTTRVQRTCSSASRRHSPLTRRPLGSRTPVGGAIPVVSAA
jgi:hypothetical protein